MRKIFNNKIFRIIYSIFKTVVLTFLVLYLVFVIIQRVTNNSSIMGYRVFTVATGSMEPVYNVNDVILVKKIDTKNIKTGDDITYLYESRGKQMIITHRVIGFEKDSDGNVKYILKGINNEVEDDPVGANQIYGKVIGKVYIINFINHVVKNIYGFFFLVFLPLVLVIFLEVADTIVEIKVEKNELKLVDGNSNNHELEVSKKPGVDDDEEEII